MDLDDEARKARNREKVRRHRERHKDDPDYQARERARSAKQRTRCPDKIKANRARYQEKHKERLALEARERWHADPRIRERSKVRHQRADVKARRQEYEKQEHVRLRRNELAARAEEKAKQKLKNEHYRKTKPEVLKALQKDWQRRNREYTRQSCANRYALRKGAEGSHTHDEWVQLCQRHGGKCAYCGCDGKLTRDHVVSLTMGGTDYIDNILPACTPCNSSKGNRVTLADIDDWRQKRSEQP